MLYKIICLLYILTTYSLIILNLLWERRVKANKSLSGKPLGTGNQ